MLTHENDSAASAVPIARWDKSSSASSTDSENEGSKSVHFAERLNQYHDSRANANNVAPQELWYSPQEQKEMKEANAVMVKNIVQPSADSAPSKHQQGSYISALEQTYRACLGATPASGGDTDHDDDSPQLDPVVLNKLREQLQHWPTRAGLEGKSTRSALEDKQRMHRILMLRMKQSSSSSSRGQDELLREQCSTLSRPRRLFAQYVAQAHQVAATSA